MKSLSASFFLAFFLAVFGTAQAADKAHDATQIKDLAAQAYIYGYPLLLMDATRELMTSPGQGAINAFNHMREFPDHTFTDIVSPNADTLYSIAWLDLRQSPVVLALPEMGERYYVMQLLDGWTNVFASLGSRTSGNRPGTFLITGPGWQGDVPQNMTQVKAPTNMVWILGRTQTNGTQDYAAVRTLQDTYQLKTLLAVTAKPPTQQEKLPPLQRVERMEAAEFFAALNRLMVDNPPALADQPVLQAISALGVSPGVPFTLESLPPQLRQAVHDGAAAARHSLSTLATKDFGTVSGGWNIMYDTIGDYGDEYLFRAYVARFGLGANRKQDAVYPTATNDAQGAPLNGANRYVLTFDRLPPVKAFWSVTMYDEQQRFVANPINRYAIGDRDSMAPDAGGGVTIYVQHAAPAKDKQANWLPAPAGNFTLILRLYWPEQAILDGSWPMPVLRKLAEEVK